MGSKEIKELLKEEKISPSRGFGQIFLVSRGILKKIIALSGISKKDVVLEIGPGTGSLTLELAKNAKMVIAIEKDPRIIPALKKVLKGVKNVEIIQGDILKIIPHQEQYWWGVKNYKVVANIPYYLTSPLIRGFLETGNRPSEMILMVQKEVAQRICARPPKMNLLAVSVQFYARPKILAYVSKKSFWPRPKVDGAIIKIVPREKQQEISNKDLFFKIVRAGFSQPRKQIVNNLSNGLKWGKEDIKGWLLKNNIKPSLRPENLTPVDWQNLAKSYKIK